MRFTIMLLILFNCMLNYVFANEPPIDIDPRKYVKVYEVNNSTKETIWELNRETYKNQKVNIIDNESKIIIEFDQRSISENIDYFGNISLEAYLNGQIIEIPFYSEVGKNRSKIGVNSISPKEITLHFLGFMDKLEELYELLEDLIAYDESEFNLDLKEYNKDQYYRQVINGIDKLEAYLREDHKNQNGDNITNANYLLDEWDFPHVINMLSRYSPKIQMINNSMANYNKQTILEELRSIKKSIDKDNAFDKVVSIKKDNYFDIYQVSQITQKYLKYFKGSNKDAEYAFLNLANIDDIAFDNLEEGLEEVIINFKDLKNFDTAALVENDRKNIEICFNLYSYAFIIYTRAKTSLDPLINNYLNNNPDYKYIEAMETYQSTSNKYNYDINNSIFLQILFNPDIRAFLFDTLATNVGVDIYKRLIYTEIDLNNFTIKDSDILSIKLLWHNIGKIIEMDTSISMPAELPLGNYKVKATGWNTSTQSSFLLIKRDVNKTGEENLSPSRFKGAPGVSLLRTYISNKRGNRIKTFFKSFEPSIGINISYLDFYTDKDLEIGVSGLVGLFNNKILTGIGTNVHTNKKPLYYFIGFNFGSVIKDIKDLAGK